MIWEFCSIEYVEELFNYCFVKTRAIRKTKCEKSGIEECIEKNVLKRMYWKESIEKNLDSTIPVIDTKCSVKIPCKKA